MTLIAAPPAPVSAPVSAAPVSPAVTAVATVIGQNDAGTATVIAAELPDTAGLWFLHPAGPDHDAHRHTERTKKKVAHGLLSQTCSNLKVRALQ